MQCSDVPAHLQDPNRQEYALKVEWTTMIKNSKTHCSSAVAFRHPNYLAPKGKSIFKQIKRIMTGQRAPRKCGLGDCKFRIVPTSHLLSRSLHSQNQPTLEDEYTATLNCSSFSTGISLGQGQFRGSLFMAVGAGKTAKAGPRAL